MTASDLRPFQVDDVVLVTRRPRNGRHGEWETVRAIIRSISPYGYKVSLATKSGEWSKQTIWESDTKIAGAS